MNNKINKLMQELIENNVGKVKRDEPLARHTTMKVGGPAQVFIEPSSVEGLETTMRAIKKYHVNWRAIGRGSNLLVSDYGIDGAVIKLGNQLNRMELDGTILTIGAGHSLVALSMLISRKGLSGLEFASGIPGSVGGAVYMNAGAHGSDISQVLIEAHILFEDGTMEWLSNQEMEFSYRTSILQKKRPGVVVEARFQLIEGDKEEIVRVMQKNKDYRKVTQPYDSPCAGSIFRNPLPHFAGKLVEEAGLKGFQIGGAQISEMHGNFIVNTGNAKAADVLELINYVKKTIYEKKCIEMKTEVGIIGKF